MNFLQWKTEDVYKFVTRSPFGVIRQHKVSGGKWKFRKFKNFVNGNCHKFACKPQTVVEGQGHITQPLQPWIILPVV